MILAGMSSGLGITFSFPKSHVHIAGMTTPINWSSSSALNIQPQLVSGRTLFCRLS